MIGAIGGFFSWLNTNSQAFVAAGVVLTAFVTLRISSDANKATRMSRVAEMRERWIERLRAEIAEISKKSLILDRASVDATFNHSEFLFQTKQLASQVRLRLRDDNPMHQRLLQALDRYLLANTRDLMDEREEELFAAAREVISHTWQKAERGEE